MEQKIGIYDSHPEDKTGLHIYPDFKDMTLLHLIRDFNVFAANVPDDVIKSVLMGICQTCGAFSICGPQFQNSRLFRGLRLRGSQTYTDPCKLGNNVGTFIPDRYFR